ncbi:uncharacterized protein LOC131955951 [Physella acuta]|uniref:uncharacterized protein LOC131955951 n=1 Tax=Physella acuta TaxID=109671 RepID=UPI0027DD35F5|nr:uncharacterized protein LOC131955951 [Physella acuta]
MDQSLNDLFSIIIQTENEAQHEKQKYFEAKCKIEQKSDDLNKVRVSTAECHERIVSLNEALCKEKTAVSMVKYKEDILSAELQTLNKEIQQRTRKLDAINQKELEDSKAFMVSVRSFVDKFGLRHGLTEQMNYEAQVSVKSLESKNGQLSTEIRNLQRQEQELRLLNDRRKKANFELNDLNNQNRGLVEMLEKEKRKISELKCQREELLRVSETGLEFLRLKSELQEYMCTEQDIGNRPQNKC